MIERTAEDVAKFHADMARISKLKKGQVVKVFQKPITDEGLEGYARLVQHHADMDDPELGERWTVQFIGPRGRPESGLYDRWVNSRNAVSSDKEQPTLEERR